jgi:hypothetical protein
MEELFNGQYYRVLRDPVANGRSTVVTFATLADKQPHKPFGAPIIRSLGLHGVHIVPRQNCWYQHDEIVSALEVASAACTGERIAYSASMGAFAAINFIDHLALDRVIACSPQYHLDHAVVPRETRWRKEALEIGPFRHHYIPRIKRDAQISVVHDPDWPLDRMHVDLIADHLKIRRVEVPGGGHTVLAHLKSLGLLAINAKALIETGGLDPTFVPASR